MTTVHEQDPSPEQASADAPAADASAATEAPARDNGVEASADEGQSGEPTNGEGQNGENLDPDGFIRAGTQELWVAARGEFREKDVSGYVPTPESDELRVEVSLFEGPFDLLLHLVDRHTFDIFDIPIATITAEYLQVLDDMRTLNLDIAGEFLVMASRLAHIKSRMLLPPEPSDDDEDGEPIDPRLELVRRLLEYQRYKEVAEAMGELPQLGRDTFARARRRPDVETSNPDDPLGVGLQEFDVIELIGIYEEILKRSKKKIVHEVIAERLSVGARINELVDFARTREHFTFRDVVLRFGSDQKRNVIVTFLSILEMARLKLVRVHQPDDGTQIYITPIQENLSEDQDEVESDFDTEAEQRAKSDAESDSVSVSDSDSVSVSVSESESVSASESDPEPESAAVPEKEEHAS
jgi:segregation and condensation protein A